MKTAFLWIASVLFIIICTSCASTPTPAIVFKPAACSEEEKQAFQANSDLILRENSDALKLLNSNDMEAFAAGFVASIRMAKDKAEKMNAPDCMSRGKELFVNMLTAQLNTTLDLVNNKPKATFEASLAESSVASFAYLEYLRAVNFVGSTAKLNCYDQNFVEIHERKNNTWLKIDTVEENTSGRVISYEEAHPGDAPMMPYYEVAVDGGKHGWVKYNCLEERSSTKTP